MKYKKMIIGLTVISMVIGSICMGIGLAMGGDFTALQVSMGFDKGGFYFRHYDDIKLEHNNLQDVTSLSVDMSIGSITMIEEDRDDIQILNTVKDQYTLDVKGSKAELTVNKSGGFSIFNLGNNYSQDIQILVPLDFEFESLELYNAMGNIELNDIKAKYLNIDIDLGDIEGNNLRTSELKIHNSMGDIQIDGIFLNESIIDNDLGDIEVNVKDDIEKYSYQTKCSLGEVLVDGREGSATRETNSEHRIDIKNELGDITLNFK